MKINNFDLSDDIEEICCNCKYEGNNFTCLSDERINDIKNNCEKEDPYIYTVCILNHKIRCLSKI